MNCIPKEIFEAQDFLLDITCTLGKGILRDPVALPCQHVFCRRCIEQALMQKSQCPTCNEPASLSSIKPSLAVAELINSIQVKCPQCGWTGEYQAFVLHEEKCSPATLPCPQGCGITLRRTQMAHHMSECRFRLVTCKDCKNPILYQELLIHEEVCPEKIIECPNHCGAKFKPAEKTAHMNSCKAPKGNCPFSFCGCGYWEAIDDKSKKEHLDGNFIEHLAMLGNKVSKLKARTEIIDKLMTSKQHSSGGSNGGNSPKKADLNIVWSTGSKIVRGEKNGWSFFLSSMPMKKSFNAKIRINSVSNDSNTWKICLGLFNSKAYQAGSWEKHKNGYGYILGNGSKVHEGGAQPYGQAYKAGDIISIEQKDGNIEFFVNGKAQGLAYAKIPGPFYLAIALSDVGHSAEILEVIELD